jgi:hypothetical protein
VRPATLDRVENGGSGSDIKPRERKPKELTRDQPSALPARDYPVCRRAHGRQGRCAPPKRWPEDGPSLTAAARVGVGNLRSGQKKACGAVKQKKEPKQARSEREVSARKKVLAFGVAIRERKDGADRTKGWDESWCGLVG